MYKLNTNLDQMLSVAGSSMNCAENPISVAPLENYIVFLPTVNLCVKEALADYQALPGYVLKSQTGFTMYSERNGWVGSLTYMEANKGYMLFRQAEGNNTSFRYHTIQSHLCAVTQRPL